MTIDLTEARIGRQLQGLKRLRGDLSLFAAECLKVKPKEVMESPLVPLAFNRTQWHVHKAAEAQLERLGRVRILVGKGRKTTVSTYVAARGYHRAIFNRGVSVIIMAHQQDTTDELFEMVSRFHEHSPVRPSTSLDNAKELVFDRLDSNIGVTTAGAKKTGRGSTPQFLQWCLAEGTLILSPDGKLRKIEDFRLGDAVRTHRNEAAPVVAISQQIKPCQQVVFRSLTSFPLVLTEEHQMWTRAGWTRMGELTPGDTVGFPVRSITADVSSLPFRLPPMRFGGKKPAGPSHVALDYDLGRLVGLYLAEGSIIAPAATNVPSGVTFTVHEDEVNRTIAWLQAVPGLYRSMRVSPTPNSKTVQVVVYSKSLGVFLRDLVGRLRDKRLPANWWTMGEKFVRGLVHGYLSGDGHFTPTKHRIIEATSICSSITTGMRDALASLGYGWASIKYKPAGLRAGRHEREAYILRLCGGGVEMLSAECGKPYVIRKREVRGTARSVSIEAGYAWLPITSQTPVGDRRVFDFEVGHEDHSFCTIHAATHNSEIAHSPNAQGHFAGIVQSVPDSRGSEIWLETTGAGPSGAFYDRWQDAEAGTSDYVAVFCPWYWTEEYTREPPPGFTLDKDDIEYQRLHGLTLGQMAWRHYRIVDLKDPILFKQEYPATATEMFEMSGRQSYIPPDVVLAARKANLDGIGPLVVGVDPARFGKDRFSVAWRRGRKILKIESRSKTGTAEQLAWLKDIIDQTRPVKMFLDAGGGGDRLYDLLVSWGKPYKDVCVLVNFGGRPQTEVIVERDGTKRAGPANRRAEMWMRSKEWLEQVGGADIPDMDSLQADAISTGFSYRLTDQCLLLESKEQIMKRGGRSPDEWDAVVLTFAEPVYDRPSPVRVHPVMQVGGGGGPSQTWMVT